MDNNVLNRPFDNYDINTNRLDAEILFWIINLITNHKIILINPAILEYENSINPFLERKIFTANILKLSKFFQNVNAQILTEAKQINKKLKIERIDSLHLSSAKFANVDYFITCDYNIIKKYSNKLRVVNSKTFLKIYENI